MRKIFILSCVFLVVHSVSAQFVATLEIKEPIPGLCDEKTVYAMFPGFGGQAAPVAPITKQALEDKLNAEVAFIKDNPKFKGSLMLSCIINCKGEMVKCEVDNKSGKNDLDEQVLAIFKTLLAWAPGKLWDNPVDCVELFSMDVKKGKITLN